VELVHGGYNQLTGANYKDILTATFEALNKKFVKAHDYYGGGQAASIITESLNQFLA